MRKTQKHNNKKRQNNENELEKYTTKEDLWSKIIFFCFFLFFNIKYEKAERNRKQQKNHIHE